MKIDKFLIISFGLILAGIDNLFHTSPYPKGSKLYCTEPGCTYFGMISFIIGISIIGYKIYKWQTEKKE
jgi:hypothetical protein